MMLLLAAGVLVMIAQGRARIVGLLLQPSVLLALLALNVLVLAYRMLAIVDAYRLVHRRWPPPSGRGQITVTAVLLGVVLGGTLLMHGWLGLIGFKTYDFVTAAFHTQEPTPTGIPTQSLSAGVRPVPTPVRTPVPVWSDNGRLDLLLIGSDSGPGRFSLRTDTMIILSVDIATGRSALFGVPRNLVNVPLPDGPADAFDCRCYPDLMNSLFVYASDHPEFFPGADEDRGYRAVQDAIGELTGLQLDGQVVITLDGFIRLVDALGGLDMTTPYSVYDANYPPPDGGSDVELFIPAGSQHFDGWYALAYARSRHQDTDYSRMDRQQEVLQALRTQLDPCTLIVRIPELLDIARDSIWTNIPVERLPDLFEIGARVKPGSIERYQFWPPEIQESLDIESVNRVRLMVSTAFTGPAPTPGPSTSATSATPASGSGSIC